MACGILLSQPGIKPGLPAVEVPWNFHKFFIYSETKLLSCVQLFATPWTTAHQAPLSVSFSRQGCWSGLPFPSPGDLPNPGIEPGSPALQADSLPTNIQGKPILDKHMYQICGLQIFSANL